MFTISFWTLRPPNSNAASPSQVPHLVKIQRFHHDLDDEWPWELGQFEYDFVWAGAWDAWDAEAGMRPDVWCGVVWLVSESRSVEVRATMLGSIV